jgi:hypothetical protein
MHGDESGIAGSFRPGTDSPQMPRAAQCDEPDAVFSRLINTDIQRLLSQHLTKTVLAIQQHECTAVDDRFHRLAKLHVPAPHVAQIAWHSHHSVAVVTGQIGLDQIFSYRPGLRISGAGSGKGSGDKRGQLVGLNDNRRDIQKDFSSRISA